MPTMWANPKPLRRIIIHRALLNQRGFLDELVQACEAGDESELAHRYPFLKEFLGDLKRRVDNALPVFAGL